MRLEFCKTGIKSGEMELISRELGERGTKNGLKNIQTVIIRILDGLMQIDGTRIKYNVIYRT